MIDQKENKKVRKDSWSLKLLSRDIKTKQKIKQQTIIKNVRKIKAMGNVTPAMDHYPRNGWMGPSKYLLVFKTS